MSPDVRSTLAAYRHTSARVERLYDQHAALVKSGPIFRAITVRLAWRRACEDRDTLAKKLNELGVEVPT